MSTLEFEGVIDMVSLYSMLFKYLFQQLSITKNKFYDVSGSGNLISSSGEKNLKQGKITQTNISSTIQVNLENLYIVTQFRWTFGICSFLLQA